MGLEKYVQMIANSDIKDDLDLVYNQYHPESGFLRFQPPSVSYELASLTSNLNLDYSANCYISQNYMYILILSFIKQQNQ